MNGIVQPEHYSCWATRTSSVPAWFAAACSLYSGKKELSPSDWNEDSSIENNQAYPMSKVGYKSSKCVPGTNRSVSHENQSLLEASFALRLIAKVEAD